MMRTLKQLIKDEGSIAAAARYLKHPYLTIFRWHHGKTKPSNTARILADQKWVKLP